MRPAASSSLASATAIGRWRRSWTRSSADHHAASHSVGAAADGPQLGRQRDLFGFAGADDLAGDGAGVVADLGDPDRLPLDALAQRADREEALRGLPSAPSSAPSS